MNSSFKTQLDIRNNADSLQQYLQDMQSWEEEIKKVEKKLSDAKAGREKDLPLPRNVAKKRQTKAQERVNAKRIPMYDYHAWDKFDAGEDSEENGEETDSDGKTDDEPPFKPSIEILNDEPTVADQATHQNEDSENRAGDNMINIDLAFMQKEMGNKLVKEGKWKEACECYSKSIKLDQSNAIYHANRALCHLKLKSFKAAEVDCTVAIQLDKSYVKAYQRRALARKALQQFSEAKCDFQQVLTLEPSNTNAKMEIEKIEEYLEKSKTPVVPIFNPKNMFAVKADSKPSRSMNEDSKIVNINKEGKENKEIVEKVKAAPIIEKERYKLHSEIPDGYKNVIPISKPTHLRSKVPLRKVDVIVSDKCKSFSELITEYENLSNRIEIVKNTNTNASVDTPLPHASKPITSADRAIKVPPVPKTSVQFEGSWKLINGNDELIYQFLKSIPASSLPQIFGSSLDSPLLSELLNGLANTRCLLDSSFLAQFLSSLTNIERFRSLVLFMKPSDVIGQATGPYHEEAQFIIQLLPLLHGNMKENTPYIYSMHSAYNAVHKTRAVESCIDSLKNAISPEELSKLRSDFDLT